MGWHFLGSIHRSHLGVGVIDVELHDMIVLKRMQAGCGVRCVCVPVERSAGKFQGWWSVVSVLACSGFGWWKFLSPKPL